jgi:hypothetical protein
MKKIIQNAAVLLLLAVLNSQFSTAHAQGTAFTYQGQLQNNGSPASGIYALSFTLFATNASGVPVAGPVTNNGVIVSNGLFTVQVDFGSGAFTGQSNWLEIAVATNLTGSFTTLSPRQAVTPAPYAIYAETASNVSGTLPASQLAGDANGNLFVGPSGNSTTTGAGNSATGESALQYNTTGNNNTANGNEALVANKTGSDNTASGYDALGANQFGSFNTAVGYQALENNDTGSNNIAVGYQAGMNINTASSNIDIGNAGTFTDNNVIRIGSGQSQTYIAGNLNGNGGGLTNLNVSASQLTGGANFNFFVGPSGNAAASGDDNTALGLEALNANTSGSDNTANGFGALYFNSIGSENTAEGYEALINNHTGSNNIALGYQAGFNVFGSSNIDIGNLGLSTDTNIIRIGSGQSQSFIAGVITGNGGGLTNLNVSASQLAGDANNNLFVGPSGNGAASGNHNTAVGIAALNNNTTGSYNTASGWEAMQNNIIGSFNTAVGDLTLNQNDSGSNNIALGFEAGYNLTGSSNIDIGNLGLSTDSNVIRIGSGQSQTFIAGTIQNPIFGGSVGIGTSSPQQALSLVGGLNIDQAGQNIGNVNSNSLTFGSGSGEGIASKRTSGGTQYDLEFYTDFNNRMTILNNGNIGIGTNNPSVPLEINSGLAQSRDALHIEATFSGTNKLVFAVSDTGVCVASSYLISSDRNAKENFTPLDAKEVLAKVISLPVSEWNYKNNSADTRHIGPMAQDFHAAFQLDGADDKHISVVDEGGVALAAIQGLNQKLQEKDAKIGELEKRLGELEATVKALAEKK